MNATSAVQVRLAPWTEIRLGTLRGCCQTSLFASRRIRQMRGRRLARRAYDRAPDHARHTVALLVDGLIYGKRRSEDTSSL